MSTCKIIRRGHSEGFHGKQGLDYFSGVSAESAGSKAICMHILAMPPGVEAKPHFHEAHETAIYMLEGARSFATAPISRSTTASRPVTSSIFPLACRISRSIPPIR